MEIIKKENGVVVKFKETKGIYNIGLGKESLSKSDDELKELAIKRYEEIKYREANPPKLSYKELRSKEYPPIPEQLDMIYWDKVYGTANWEKTIAAVKKRFPKG